MKIQIEYHEAAQIIANSWDVFEIGTALGKSDCVVQWNGEGFDIEFEKEIQSQPKKGAQ